MIFGKHINRYYLRYLPVLLLGLAALVAVDYVQLKVPELYNLVINGMNDGSVQLSGETVPFDMNFLLDSICRPHAFHYSLPRFRTLPLADLLLRLRYTGGNRPAGENVRSLQGSFLLLLCGK